MVLPSEEMAMFIVVRLIEEGEELILMEQEYKVRSLTIPTTEK